MPRPVLLAVMAVVSFVLPSTASAASGDIDAAFGSAGQASLVAGHSNSGPPAAVVPQSGGKALVFGTAAEQGGTTYPVMTRVTARGALDVGFDGDGVKRLVGLGTRLIDAVALPGGDVAVLTGATGGLSGHAEYRLSRLTAAGDPVAAFGGTGTIVGRYEDFRNDQASWAAPGVTATRLALQGTRLYVGVEVVASSSPSNRSAAIAAYGTGGASDLTFGGDGFADLPVGYAASGPRDLSPTATGGKLYVLGSRPGGVPGARHAVLRLDADGTPDPSFGAQGVQVLDFGADAGNGEDATAVQALPGDGVAVAGYPTSSGNVALVLALTDSGALQTAFGAGGRVTPGADRLTRLGLLDGLLYAVGTHRDAGNVPVVHASRYGASGLDATFGTGGVSNGSLALLPSVLTQTDDGFLFVAGDDEFTSSPQDPWQATRFDLADVRVAVLAAPATAADPNGDHGFADLGATITATPAAWYYGGTVTRRWQRCDGPLGAQSPLATACTDIAGETGLQHVATGADAGRHVRVVETNSSAAGDATAATATLQISDPPITVVFATSPSIAPAGTVTIGTTVRATWVTTGGHPGGSSSVTWYQCDTAASGCRPVDADNTGDDAYSTTAADLGKFLRAVVAVSGGHIGEFASQETTNAVQVLAGGAAPAPVNTAAPTIAPAGSVVEGTTLQRAGDGGWDQTGLTYGYRWERCATGGGAPAGCAAIGGASGATYATTGQDAGRFVRLLVDARQGGGPVGTAASAVTAVTARPVEPAPTLPTPPASPGPGFIITKIVDTTSRVKMPDVRGLKIDAAEAKIRAAGIYADIDQQSVTRTPLAKLNGKALDVGDVSAQSVSAGTPVTSGIGTLKRLRLVTEAGAKATASNGGAFGSACVGGAVRDDLVGVELADVMDLLAAKRCTKLDLDFTLSTSAKELEVRRATKGDGKLKLTIVVPGKADNTDLAVVLRQGAFTTAAPFGRDDWALTAGTANVFGVQTINRAGQTVDKAEVLVDGTDVDATDRRVQAGGGVAVIGGFAPKTAGIVNVLVSQSDRYGNKLFGFRRFRVIRRTTGFTGIDARRFDKSGTPSAGGRAVAHAAGWDDFLRNIKELARAVGLGGLFDGRPPEQVITSAARQNAASAVLLGPPGVVASGGANAVASGGANAVASGGANAVASGGANAVASGGANAVAAGGLNLLSLAKATAVAAGGANTIGRDVVANNRGSLFTTPNGSSLISDNGLGLISDNGLGLISDNGLG